MITYGMIYWKVRKKKASQKKKAKKKKAKKKKKMITNVVALVLNSGMIANVGVVTVRGRCQNVVTLAGFSVRLRTRNRNDLKDSRLCIIIIRE